MTYATDHKDPVALTPAYFLNPGFNFTTSTSVLPPEPPNGDALRGALKQTRTLLDGLWSRWKQEYITSLQGRPKWLAPQRNLRPGDLVLLVNEKTARGIWPLAIILEVFPDAQGLVRNVRLRTAKGKEYERNVTKLVFLEGDQ